MRLVSRYIPAPMTSGESIMANGKGGLRGCSGSRGSVNLVTRIGRARRGGRLKLIVGAPGVGEVTASAAGTGLRTSRLSPTVRTAFSGQKVAPLSGRRSSSRKWRWPSGSRTSRPLRIGSGAFPLRLRRFWRRLRLEGFSSSLAARTSGPGRGRRRGSGSGTVRSATPGTGLRNTCPPWETVRSAIFSRPASPSRAMSPSGPPRV